MNYEKSAKEIIEFVGGKDNVAKLIHCSTRLRFTLNDFDKVNLEKLKKVSGVLGAVIAAGQCQVIIGNTVIEMYDAVMSQLGTINTETKKNDKSSKKKWYEVLLDFIIAIFQPLIPAIAGGGILKSLLMLLNLLGVLEKTTSTYKILMFIGDAPLYFLPLLVAITTANKLKSNSLVTVSAVGALLLPGMTEMITQGTNLAGISIQNVNYSYQVFPAILCAISYAFLERFFTKISPKVIRSFFVPMMSLLIVVPVTLIVLGPIGFMFGQVFASTIMFIFAKFGWIAVALLAAFLPFMVVTGMHKAMIPYVITSLGETGKEVIYNAASLAHNISEAGASFAVMIRTKDKDLKATAASGGISALFGITEPALYGVTILHKRVLYGVMIGSLIGGASLGLLGVEAYVAVGPGIASLSMFISEKLPNNLMYAVIGLIISFVASFISVLILWKEPINEEDNKTEKLVSPVKGEIISLSEVDDSVFSSGVLGEGIAIKPKEGLLTAPADGNIMMVYETGHAMGLKTKGGAEVLFHVGIDTVKLQGKYFETLVSEGQAVKQGEPLIKFDLDKIKEAGFDPTVMMIVTEYNDDKVEFPEVSLA